MKKVWDRPQSKFTQKLVTIFPDDDGAVLVKPEKASRSTRNAFKKLLKNLTEFSTD